MRESHMRIVVDLQAAQAENAHRGIGRYATSLVDAMVDQRDKDEIVVLLNGRFRESTIELASRYRAALGSGGVHIWEGPEFGSGISGNPWLVAAGEEIYRNAIRSLRPDVVLIGSFFEGMVDEAICAPLEAESGILTATVLYDLIPLIHAGVYLRNPDVDHWYRRRLGDLDSVGLLLAISDSSRRDAIHHLRRVPNSVVSIGAAVGSAFRPQQTSESQRAAFCASYGVTRKMLMYTGGFDPRKNFDRLIAAYAGLPRPIRERHQLVLVCSADDNARASIAAARSTNGLTEHEVVLTGYVPDADLLKLYDACTAFVFPSLHEGFGLPALEAMAMGKAVIVADSSSLPEIVTNADARFDPLSVGSISAAMARVLTDDAWRSRLEQEGTERAAAFSWSTVASNALRELRSVTARRARPDDPVTPAFQGKPRLAYVSPIAPLQSGISDYSGELLPHLAEHYEIELILAQDEVTDERALTYCRIRSVEWFRRHSSTYDRVLYHFGNSEFHGHMFDLIREIPGVLVLHDFFLSGIVAHRDGTGERPGSWAEELYHSHGYAAYCDRFTASDTADVVYQYPANLSVLQAASGVIVHSEYSRALARDWYGRDAADDWVVIPQLRNAASHPLDRIAARARLGIPDSTFLICSFGMVAPTKLHHELVEAWTEAGLVNDPSAMLAIVGELQTGLYGEELSKLLSRRDLAGRVIVTGRVTADQYDDYLIAADAAVQLRTRSRGETSRSVLDCFAHAVPTILNANGSMAEYPDDVVIKLDDDCSVSDIAGALRAIQTDTNRRRLLAERAHDLVRTNHDPGTVAQRFFQVIEQFAASPPNRQRALARAVAANTLDRGGTESIRRAARAIAHSVPRQPRGTRLLVDVSELARHDAGTGIQRVTRSITRELLLHPPAGYRVEPVYATTEHTYVHAHAFTAALLDVGPPSADCPLDIASGDIFLGLDYQPVVVPAQLDWLRAQKSRGLQLCFVLYDLLILQMPQHFLPGAQATFHRWLNSVCEVGEIIAISKTVANELQLLIDQGTVRQPEGIGWFHLGSDLETGTAEATGTDYEQRRVLRPRFLMVGTLEPRKSHSMVLDAFQVLWDDGVDVELVIVGKVGWMVEGLVDRLQGHPEANSRLMWLDGVDDERLDRLYESASYVIAASEGEGFGLPVVEALQRSTRVLCRDIPVFREVAGDAATYFTTDLPNELAIVIRQCIGEPRELPKRSTNYHTLTWAESTDQLLAAVLGSRSPTPRGARI